MRKPHQPILRQRPDHSISRKRIDPDALSVLYRLSNAGYTAYLVGGGVRDLLLDRAPKDFDIATDAHPRDIRALFRNAFLIGRRFRLALIRFGPKQIETSTFRRQPAEDEVDDSARPGALYRSEDNTYGTPEEDAQRRDFTVNGLFYDIKSFAVIDYVGGLRDLDRRILRSIGDPNIRFREDPVRMMRAVRFAARLGFRIHRDSDRAIARHYQEIEQASKPRLYEEILKLFGQGCSRAAFQGLWSSKLASVLLPQLHEYIEHSGRKKSPLWKHLDALDALGEDNDSAALRIATLFCPLYMARLHEAATSSRPFSCEALADDLVANAFTDAFAAQSWRPPRLVCIQSANMLAMQAHFEERDMHFRGARVFSQAWFPGALLLFRIRCQAGDVGSDDLHGWLKSFEEYRERHPRTHHPRGRHHEKQNPARPDREAAESADTAARHPRRRRRRGRAARSAVTTPTAS